MKYKGYEIERTADTVRVKLYGMAKTFVSVAAAKRWINCREALPLEQREPFDF